MHKHASAQNAYPPCASVCGAPEIPPSNVWPGSEINVKLLKDVGIYYLQRERYSGRPSEKSSYP